MCFDIIDIHLMIIFFIFFNIVHVSSGGCLLNVNMTPFLHLCINKPPINKQLMTTKESNLWGIRKSVKEHKIFLPFLNKYQIMKKMKEDIHDDIIRYFERIQEFQNNYEYNINDMTYIKQKTNLTTDIYDDLIKIITLIF